MLGRLSPAYPRTDQLRRPWRFPGFSLLRLCVISLTLVATLVVHNALGIWLYPQLTPLSCRADTALVMGAAQYNGVPSPAFKRRLDKALELYRAGCASQIVVTGGSMRGDVYTEGEAGKRYLAAQGIPLAVLYSETKSTTSYENLVNSRELISGRQLTIVTDDMHAYRTRFLAQYLGYSAELAPVYAPFERWTYSLSELVKLSAYQFGVLR